MKVWIELVDQQTDIAGWSKDIVIIDIMFKGHFYWNI